MQYGVSRHGDPSHFGQAEMHLCLMLVHQLLHESHEIRRDASEITARADVSVCFHGSLQLSNASNSRLV